MDTKTKGRAYFKVNKQLEHKISQHIYEEFMMVAHINSQCQAQLNILRKGRVHKK